MKNGERARVRVRVTLMVDAGAKWDGDHTLNQVESEAEKSALRIIERLLSGKPLGGDVEAVQLFATEVESIEIRPS